MGAYIRLATKKSHPFRSLIAFAIAAGFVGFCADLAWTEDETRVPEVPALQSTLFSALQTTEPVDLEPVTTTEAADPSAEKVAMVTSTDNAEVIENAVAQAHAQ